MDRLPEQPGIGDPPVPKAYGEPRRRADARAATTDEDPKVSSDAAAGGRRRTRRGRASGGAGRFFLAQLGEPARAAVRRCRGRPLAGQASQSRLP
ncbi:hypothetical protein, partial [Streptomyces sp. SID685]|uniref:hypothetical protein n=1 Tax=Streptomyces sp. SID685 TaxID=2690322 RepID=UPI001F1FDA5B